MSLLNLAPDIQEAILFLPKTVKGRDVSRENPGTAPDGSVSLCCQPDTKKPVAGIATGLRVNRHGGGYSED